MKGDIVRMGVERIMRKFPVIPGRDPVQYLAQLAICLEWADRIDAGAEPVLDAQHRFRMAIETLEIIDRWCDEPHEGRL